jgi:galactoside O-acetyltransferase
MLTRLLAPFAAALTRMSAAHEAARILSLCRATGDVRLRMPVKIYDPEKLEFGDRVDVGEFTHIRANGGVRIGNRVLIAANVTITSREHPVALPRWGVTTDAPVVIEDDVWIGAGAVILPGVTIGRGSVIAAGAVVTADVPPFTVAGGVPARMIKQVPQPESH